jgi:hypothetical protein
MATDKFVQRNVGFFFIAVLCATLLGFFPTYFSHFPTFDGFTWAYHFHAFVALTWIGMLIAQAFLIRAKNFRVHRQVGKASYFVMPLLLVSIFLMVRAQYHKNILVNHLSETDALAAMSRNGILDLVFVSILYALGIRYKKRTALHLRFFTCLGLVIMGPGLSRFLFAHYPPQVAGPILGVLFLLVPLIWLILDLVKKRSPVPLLIYIGVTMSSVIMQGQGQSSWWQSFAKRFADTLF